MHAIQITEHGSADVMRWVELDDPTAAPGQVVVELGAAGLNFIDTYQRSGLYQVGLPYVLGLEGAGTVVEVGDGVDHLVIGDRIAWASTPGSYAERVAVPAAQAMKVPDGIDWEVAAAIPLQGMTAHYLAVDTYPLGPDDTCLIHAGAGGVGLLLIQIAKLRGAEVYTTVGTPEKAELTKAAGADHTVLYRDVDFAEAIRGIAGTERPLDVVYDGVGKSVFSQSLSLIRQRGMMVTFGNASGPVDPVSPLDLSANGSIFLTRPTLFHYASTPDEIQARADDLFGWHAAGDLDVRIGERFALADAADAHRALEGRATTGKVVLLP
ncbi:MAG: quinone oxidoreductase [Ilumatobacter fluminis]|uniref:quinone oxidoreductase family protein n=1 Tax=Ilumatobacter fluminis TaxID=467091 RepID=UPI0032EB1311